jgi:hypothetical protein
MSRRASVLGCPRAGALLGGRVDVPLRLMGAGGTTARRRLVAKSSPIAMADRAPCPMQDQFSAGEDRAN